MTGHELIALLEQEDLTKEVKLRSATGGLKPVSSVDSEIERDPFDGDWDTGVIVID